MRRLSNILIGADIETFLYDNNDKRYVSAIGRIGGSKEFPRNIISDGYSLQEDNVLLEFTIPPVRSEHDFIRNINTIKNVIPEYIKPFVYHFQASAHFPEEELRNPMALEFGCSPDFNCWTGEKNPKPKGNKTDLRVSGFHFHISYDEANEQTSMELMKALDLFLGVESVLLDPDTERRQLYGKAGSFRFTDYGSARGAEYRVLSGFFCKDDKMLSWAYNGVLKAIEFINEGNMVGREYSGDIIRAINTCDRELASSILTSIKQYA